MKIKPEALMLERNDFALGVSEIINQAVWPWRMRQAYVFYDYDLGAFQDRITIEIRYGVEAKDLFFYRNHIPADLSPEEVALYLADGFFHEFRSWRELEPESNVVLGEN